MKIVIETGYYKDQDIKNGETIQERGWVSSDSGTLFSIYAEGHEGKAEVAFSAADIPKLVMDAMKIASDTSSANELGKSLTPEVVNLAMEVCEFLTVPDDIAKEAIYHWLGSSSVPSDVCEAFGKAAKMDVPRYSDKNDLDLVIMAANEAAAIMWGNGCAGFALGSVI